MSLRNKIGIGLLAGLGALVALEGITTLPSARDSKQQDYGYNLARPLPPTSAHNLEETVEANLPGQLIRGEASYSEFPYQDEVSDIMRHSERVGVDPILLMAIRSSENGRDKVAYGILPRGPQKRRYERDLGYVVNGERVPYKDEKEKQLAWAAHTVRKKFEAFSKNSEGHKDFISYLAAEYAPRKAKNDPKGLNKNWERNVRQLYELYSN